MSKELGSWVGLKDLFLFSSTNIRNSSSVDDEILNSNIVEIDFEGIFLRGGLINYKKVKSERDGLMGFQRGENSGYNFTSV